MKNKRIIIGVLALFSLLSSFANDIDVARGLVDRLIPQFSSKINFEKITGNERFVIDSHNGNVIISGNNANSMAVGLNYYLKYFCHTTVPWYASDKVEMPQELPLPKAPLTVESKCNNRFFLNYCTFGYTMPWWKWEDWERLIDWMALNGVNMPLAITGQEYVWYQVWKKLGMSDNDIRNYFTGPAHLPWHRMSNLDKWQGGLPIEWLEDQCELQKKILQREREFAMKPVLPAFAGHVPQKLKEIYPQSKITQMSSWGGFADEYRSYFMDPLDEMFPKIQKMFLEEEIRLFGTDNIYGADPFNEVMPPSWEPDFLAKCSKSIYKTIADVDPDAVWLQMTWLFYIDRQLWTNERVEAFLKAVPQDRLMLLDYYCENTEVWKQTDKYFGQPYLWCYLGNFGGNTMLCGNIDEVKNRIDNVVKNGGDNFSGLGSTLEGFDVNPFMYEFVFEQAWDMDKTTDVWIRDLADRHLGCADKNFRSAWRLLKDSVYTTSAALGQGTLTNARPALAGQGNWTTTPAINYDNSTLLKAWGLMLKAKNTGRDTYNYDIVNVGRQVLGNYYMTLRDRFAKAYYDRSVTSLREIGSQMKQLLMDLDDLLSTRESFLLGKWIDAAGKMSNDESSKKYYRENARNIVTTWGGRDQSLNDYANRSWAGLTRNYYLPRWSMFIDRVIDAVENNNVFDELKFHRDVTDMEWNFVGNDTYFSPYTIGNSYNISKRLFDKYEKSIAVSTEK